eukprot:gb/GECH01006953.1/.p1 GENE.gb/GECH01006953.1/~~gb/GECH01006953.1/.p1  ORF type:complete len:238 (+),score=24.56 gb/GECH01006953.1/:1-714(+)
MSSFVRKSSRGNRPRQQPHKLPRTAVERDERKRLIVVLDQCPLETAKVGKDYRLLDSDEHGGYLRRKGKDPTHYRPDITHQCLLSLLDSPLNKAGLLQVYIQTTKNVLIEVSPQCRIPRTYKRFCGLMVQLLHKLKIKASETGTVLMRVIKNPITDHLPPGCRRLACSKEGKLVRVSEFVNTLPPEKPTVFVIGGFSHGKLETNWAEEFVAVSQYGLSAAGVCGKLCDAYEQLWGVL